MDHLVKAITPAFLLANDLPQLLFLYMQNRSVLEEMGISGATSASGGSGGVGDAAARRQSSAVPPPPPPLPGSGCELAAAASSGSGGGSIGFQHDRDLLHGEGSAGADDAGGEDGGGSPPISSRDVPPPPPPLTSSQPPPPPPASKSPPPPLQLSLPQPTSHKGSGEGGEGGEGGDDECRGGGGGGGGIEGSGGSGRALLDGVSNAGTDDSGSPPPSSPADTGSEDMRQASASGGSGDRGICSGSHISSPSSSNNESGQNDES